VQGESAEEDADLVSCMIDYQAGRIDGFERVYAALAPGLRRFLAAGLPDAGGADDLLQETFLEIHRARRTYLPPLPVRPWAFGVAKNVLRRHRRSAGRRAAREQEAQASAARDADGPTPALPPAAPGRSERELMDAVDQLPPGRREAWVLHHLQGLSFRQIAARLRIGVTAARLRSSRASKALRSALGSRTGDRDE